VQLIEASGGFDRPDFDRPDEDRRPWRDTNPRPIPSERESYVMAQGLPVYRVLYRRNNSHLAPLE